MPTAFAVSVSVYAALPETKENPVNWAFAAVAYCVSNATVPLTVMAVANEALPMSAAPASTVTDLEIGLVK